MRTIIRSVIGVFWLTLALSGLAEDLNRLNAVKVLPLPDSRVSMVFIFEKPLKQAPTRFEMHTPARLVFDFGSAANAIPAGEQQKKPAVGALQSYAIVGAGNRVRAVLNLKTLVAYSVALSENRFTVTLRGEALKSTLSAHKVFPGVHPVSAEHHVMGVDFRGSGKNSGKLMISVSDPNMPVNVEQRGQNVILTFVATRLATHLARELDVADFQTPAQTIDARQKGDNTEFAIANKGDYNYFSYQIDQTFVVEVSPLSQTELQDRKLKKQVFRGKLISLNFQDIKTRAVLQLLSDFIGVNMVVSDSVSGNITLRLNRVPSDQALDLILKTKGLSERKVGNVILVAPSAEISAMEKQQLQEELQVEELAPLTSELLQINYAKASDLANLLKTKGNSVLSSRGNVSVDQRTNTLWIQDTSDRIEVTRHLVHKLDVPVKQVLIESRIVVVNKDFAKDLGVRFGVSKEDHLSGTLDGASEMAAGTAAADVPVTDRLNVDLAAAPVTGEAGTIGLALAKLGNGILLDLELSALESEGMGEVISSPRLITANQQPAFIESGEEIPYQEATSSGATAIAFKKAVLSLKVTPQITPDNRIILDLTVNQDTPSTQLFLGVPAILTKEIQTNVLVNNGQTLVLGGIYKQDKTNSVERIPFLGTLPWVGALFRTTSESISHEELLIFITPKIIEQSFVTNDT